MGRFLVYKRMSFPLKKGNLILMLGRKYNSDGFLENSKSLFGVSVSNVVGKYKKMCWNETKQSPYVRHYFRRVLF